MQYLESERIAKILSFADGVYRIALINFRFLQPLEVAVAFEAMAARIRVEERNKAAAAQEAKDAEGIQSDYHPE